jgi:hypothetical protein
MAILAMVFIVALVSVQPPQSAPRDAAAPNTGTPAISGRITEKDTGRPLYRAFVTLTPVGQEQWHDAVADAEADTSSPGWLPASTRWWLDRVNSGPLISDKDSDRRLRWTQRLDRRRHASS